MNKRYLMTVTLGLAVVLVAGGLFASNMGFKLNYPLQAADPGISRTGTNTLGLPYNQQTNLTDAADLLADIEATVPGSVISIAKFLRTSDTLQAYTGGSFVTNFTLAAGEGYRVQVGLDVDYIVVGSHDPGKVINLDTVGTNGSATGTNDYAHPYHGVASTASELRDEINSAVPNAVISIAKFLRTSDTLQAYTGGSNLTNFNLEPGASYRVQVQGDVSLVPSHY